MKSVLFAALVALVAVNAQAQYRTANNLPYSIATDAVGSEATQCFDQVCEIADRMGRGCQARMENIGVAVANLSSRGAEAVADLECVIAVEGGRTLRRARGASRLQ